MSLFCVHTVLFVLAVPVFGQIPVSAQESLRHLASVMDSGFDRLPVYEDVSSPENHFVSFAKIPTDDPARTVNGSWPDRPQRGATSIRFALSPLAAEGFGGYYLLNGVLEGLEQVPKPNWGTFRNAGLDLTGAISLTFYARGEKGGEIVDFFVGGVGREPESGAIKSPCIPGYPGQCPAPDSTRVLKLSGIRLTTSWQRYSIPLTGDLSYMISGFGWVASVGTLANINPDGVAFFVDSIAFDLSDAAKAKRLAQPRFLRSFVTRPFQPDPNDSNTADDFDLALRSTAFPTTMPSVCWHSLQTIVRLTAYEGRA